MRMRRKQTTVWVAILCHFVLPIAGTTHSSRADEPAALQPLLGYSELRTDLPGGRHANVRTTRAMLMRADGTGRAPIAEELADNSQAWTQFAGWSPDGKVALVSRIWQDPENARWEEEYKTFRFGPGRWSLDAHLVDLASRKTFNVTGVERVSDYNGGLFYLPDGQGFGFTPLIDGISKPFVMHLDGTHKRDVSGNGTGFSYGYSASPDGELISYHENYQVYVSRVDGSEKRHVATGNPFNFAPRWSPDGKWLMFVSGEHYNCHPYLVQRDGSGLRKLADRGGYRGVIEFLDVFDFHGGSSDLPVWSADGQSVFYTAQVPNPASETGPTVELFQTTLDGTVSQLTHTPAGSLHYHPTPHAAGKWLLYGSRRAGVRQLFVMNLADRSERQITQLTTGHAAMWPHWQPESKP